MGKEGVLSASIFLLWGPCCEFLVKSVDVHGRAGRSSFMSQEKGSE